MIVLLAVLAAIFGGVVGAVIGFFGIYGIGLLTGADTQQGALAMGAAATGIPLGGLVGALLGGIFAVRLWTRRGARARSARSGGVQLPGTFDESPEPYTPPEHRRFGPLDWAALALVAAGAAGFFIWLNWTDEPWRIRGAQRPVLHVEIRVPADDPDIGLAVTRGIDLRNGNVYHSGSGIVARDEGEYTVLSARHSIAYKTEDRSVELWLGQERLLVFNLDLARKPVERPEFSEWRNVDEVRSDFYGSASPVDEHDYSIRTKVLWGPRP